MSSELTPFVRHFLELVRTQLEAHVGESVSWTAVAVHLGESRQNLHGYVRGTRPINIDKVHGWLNEHNRKLPDRPLEIRLGTGEPTVALGLIVLEAEADEDDEVTAETVLTMRPLHDAREHEPTHRASSPVVRRHR